MSNPWLKKNPFMSVWLSTANRMDGSLRGLAAVQVKRQVNAAATDATRENLKLGSDTVKPATAPSRRRR